MSDVTDLIERYIAVWNETDVEQRRQLITQTWTEDAIYLDPVMKGEGHTGINEMISGVQARFAGHRFRRTGDIDSHHDRVRFTWELAPEDGDPVVGGTDFGVVAADGRLQAITGFFDNAAAAQSEKGGPR